ncbi:hypothetical protein A1O7_02832 [Cladophialophora yegresii CBS 114405]|uniref:Uncharacterized protein n=1 Tax=Cladophialophora yegresii CBS 114405 TaxID=1182544 RepID=W9W2W5_9EURO|nr:uncharacterized protein A1O7_02832 [Cladophialophora yegresii CBS 114405]EXJ62397.1 hypothetical protein A1O7_02832 [Cladophialophora yegresii CBS 114405]
MAYQDPEVAAFQEGDLFEHESGKRLKLVYREVKIQGRQDTHLRPYNPPRESLLFERADGIVDNSNCLPNYGLATGPRDMEMLVGVGTDGAEKSGEPWKNFKLLRPKLGSDADGTTEYESLGTLDEVRTNWNNRWSARSKPGEGDTAGPSGDGDGNKARGKNSTGRKRKSMQAPPRKTSARAGSLAESAGSRRSQSLGGMSAQPQALATHESLLGHGTPGAFGTHEQHGNQSTYNAQPSYPPPVSQYNKQYAGNPAFQQNTYASTINPNASTPYNGHQAQVQEYPQAMQQMPTFPYGTTPNYNFGGGMLDGSQMLQQPNSAFAQQMLANQLPYEQQTQPWPTGEQTHWQQQWDNGNDPGDETVDELDEHQFL